MTNDDMKYICIRLISGLKFIEFDDIETGKPCLKTSQGFKGCKLFLSNIEVVNEILEIEASDRIYRGSFTNNYKALFPYPNKRFYRVDVLEASIEGYTSIWVNGERFEFNSNVIQAGKELHESWICLVTLIFQIKDLIEERIKKEKDLKIFGFEDELWKANVINVLKRFDQSWVEFEREYITELIAIENVARRFILNLHKHMLENEILNNIVGAKPNAKNNDAIFAHEMHKEEKFENSGSEESNLKSEIQCSDLDPVFFELIKNLFRVLNLNNKYCVTENINLSTWEQIMQIKELAANSPHSSFSVVGALSMHCVAEMTILLEKVADACKVPEKIDPHICNNLSLQQQILRVDETWGIARKQFSKLVSMEKEDVDKLSLVQLVKLLQKVFSIQFQIRRRIKGLEIGEVIMELGSVSNFEEICLWENIFVEKLEECDVVALLALPKICCILYLVNPGICSDMISQFLNNERSMELHWVQQEETESIEDKLMKNQIFRGVKLNNALFNNQRFEGENCSVENSFLNMVTLWNSFTEIVLGYEDTDFATTLLVLEAGGKSFNKEEILFVYIFSLLTGTCLCGESQINNCKICNKETKIIQENEFIKKSEKLLNSLIISIEEVSILLQRVSASEWNEFIQTAVICITKSPVILEETINVETNQKENEIGRSSSLVKFEDNNSTSTTSNNSACVVNNARKADFSSFVINNTKLQSFFSNIGSIIYQNVKSYGKFTTSRSSVAQETPESSTVIMYSSSNSNFDNATHIL
ncbi:phospho-2-dehydro-3-deoxyheptonate aldolase [Cryptosporidium sp. chipmunk genotype I]|uniref:phospho-2-dehydro-3-deoxyheptonate aldolase n=1 Tax=Cryptosporidium sp. chipmunk genotype I TaxID=1280935 RepID=UPI003519F4AF|nr:phospho-2-dehydro-3-deoxyheptonate aldolase [Cryptosporidium sp. chipmunk genotype I]